MILAAVKTALLSSAPLRSADAINVSRNIALCSAALNKYAPVKTELLRPMSVIRFHSPPRTEPPGFGIEQRGLGGWLSAWQFAIFEMFFHFGAAALPVLRRVAFGEYDWTQGNAIEALVRLAAVGVEREQILAELRREFPGIRYEAQLYSVGPLLRHAARDPAVEAVVRELEDLPEW